jgi:AcrR family transcriptional regulator
MCQSLGVVVGEQRIDEEGRRSAIHDAAVRVFSAQGFAATSMADIAEAAGMSRPALYQYFRNKQDVFASAFASLFDDAVDRALAELNGSASTAARLDGFLQRFHGDLWERMAGSPHSEELLAAKYRHAAEATSHALERLSAGLDGYLSSTGRDRATRAAWGDLLELSPRGFKLDEPSVETYRHRLTVLARSVAADIDGTSPGAGAAAEGPRTGAASPSGRRRR